MRYLIFVLATILILSCSTPKEIDRDTIIGEIEETERQFSNMSAEAGVKEAFLHFAADDAVMNRQGKIIKGKPAITQYFDDQTLSNVSLQWEPEFIDVSKFGDLAYTYGKFNFSATDTTGQEISAQGYFHTVWKRQTDGSWKFVYD